MLTSAIAITGTRLKLLISVKRKMTKSGIGTNTYMALAIQATIATGAGINENIPLIAKPVAPAIKIVGKIFPP